MCEGNLMPTNSSINQSLPDEKIAGALNQRIPQLTRKRRTGKRVKLSPLLKSIPVVLQFVATRIW